jgi:hypothetical protein
MMNEPNQDGVFGGIISDAQTKAAEEKTAKRAGHYKAEGRDSLGRPVKETVDANQSVSVAPEVIERKRAAMALGVNPDNVSAEPHKKSDNTNFTLAQKMGLKREEDVAAAASSKSGNAMKQAVGDQSKR